MIQKKSVKNQTKRKETKQKIKKSYKIQESRGYKSDSMTFLVASFPVTSRSHRPEILHATPRVGLAILRRPNPRWLAVAPGFLYTSPWDRLNDFSTESLDGFDLRWLLLHREKTVDAAAKT